MASPEEGDMVPEEGDMVHGSKKAIKRSETSWSKRLKAAAVRAARKAGARRRKVRRAGQDD